VQVPPYAYPWCGTCMFSPLVSALWFVAATLKLVLMSLLLRRKLYRFYPIFFAYAVYNVALNIGLYFARASYSAYFYIYWAGEVLGVALCFGAIYEIFANLFSRYDALRTFVSVLFKWSAAVLVIGGIALTKVVSTDSYPLIGSLLVVQRSIAAVQTGLLILLFFSASSLGITWRHYAFGISAGFGALGCTNLVTLSIRTQIGNHIANLYTVAHLAAYIAAQVIWLSYFARFEPAVPVIDTAPKSNLDDWNQTLRQVLQR
jgi:hypothetical protein